MAYFLYVPLSAIATIQTILVVTFLIGLLYRMKRNKKRVCVVVLGDIGRSPRMQYHAMSYVKENFKIDIVGFHGSSPVAVLQNNANVSFTYLLQTPSKPSWMPGFIYYIIKAAFYAFQLLFVLIFVIEKPGHFLVQNPPSIPTLAAIWLTCSVKGSQFIIDWHNYGYTILSLNTKSKRSILVKFACWFEQFFGYYADKSICVTRAMKNDLKKNWNIDSSVLYDRPPEHFCKTNIADLHTVFLKLSNEGYFITPQGTTPFTECVNNEIVLKKDRPAIVISSTSWTEDEDFSILLEALELYDSRKKRQSETLPDIVCIITGKGPLKSFYQKVIKEKALCHVTIITPWLTMEDYPKIIGSGDLGVCLHTSSSGLDLPMKVVDMFGCGLPVCAISFSCLNELVKHDENGLVFDNSKELASQLVELLKKFPENEQLASFRKNLQTFQANRWHENWLSVIPELLNDGE